MNSIRYIVEGGSGKTLEPGAHRILAWLMARPNAIHTRDAICEGALIVKGGRSVDTFIANARKCLGPMRDCIVTNGRKGGYGWIGEPVELCAVTWTQAKARPNIPMAQYAVMTQEEVAAKLNMTRQQVNAIEKRALMKLRSNPRIRKAWKDMLVARGRHHYDPFYECWLFAVQEEVASPYTGDQEEGDE